MANGETKEVRVSELAKRLDDIVRIERTGAKTLPVHFESDDRGIGVAQNAFASAEDIRLDPSTAT